MKRVPSTKGILNIRFVILPKTTSCTGNTINKYKTNHVVVFNAERTIITQIALI